MTFYDEIERYIKNVRGGDKYIEFDSYRKYYSSEEEKQMSSYYNRLPYETKSVIEQNKMPFRESMDFEEYFDICKEKICKNSDEIEPKFEKLIEFMMICANEDKTKLSREKIESYLLVKWLLKPYQGYFFERIIKDALTHRIFTIEYGGNYDNNYKVDIVVRLNWEGYEDYKIGLQLKSAKFFRLSTEVKSKYFNGNKKCIDDNVVDDIYYLFHKDMTVVDVYNKALVNYNKVSSYGRSPQYKETNIESVIDDMLYIFFHLKYNTDNISDVGSVLFGWTKESCLKNEFRIWKNQIKKQCLLE